MRVLMTADGVGGVFGFVVELSRELAARGVDVTLAVMGPPLDPGQRSLLGDLPRVEVYERACALEWMQEPWREVDAASEWLEGLAERCSPDVVHLNGYSQATRDYGAPKLVVAHSCLLGWWRAVRGAGGHGALTAYAARVRAGLDAADFVVAPT